MPATVIAERIGWERSITVLRDRVRELRPAYLPVDPASRTAYDPGELAQCDLWFPPVAVPLGVRAGRGQPAGAGAVGLLAVAVRGDDLLAGIRRPDRGPVGGALQLGAVPKALVWDKEGAVGRWRAGQAPADRGVQCVPRDPRRRAWSAARPIRSRRASSSGPTGTWRPRSCPAACSPPRRTSTPSSASGPRLVNGRVRRALGCAPADRIAADRAAMLALPPVAPETGWRCRLRLPRDHYVRLDSNDYSVHPAVIGRRIEVVAGLDRVRAFCGGQLVADHERAWAWHQTITDPEHRAAAAALRRDRVGVLRPAGRAGGRAAVPGRLRRPGRRRRRGGVMAAPAAKKARDLDGRDRVPDPGAEGAQRCGSPSTRLAERARAETWSHEEFLVACLQREVAARDAHGGEGRIRAARFPARKSLEEFDFDHARGLHATPSPTWAPSTSSPRKDNVVFLGPPGTGKTHLATGIAIRACQAGHRVQFATASQWVDRLAAAHRAGTLQAELTRLARYPCWSSTRSVTSRSSPRPPCSSSSSPPVREGQPHRHLQQAVGRWGEVFGDESWPPP